MLKEGAIFQTYMLTKLVRQTPVAEIYQTIDVESGNRYLLKIAKPEWDPAGGSNYHAFNFSPGIAKFIYPSPAEILKREVEFLRALEPTDFGLPKPVSEGELEGIFYCSYEIFDGLTLQEHLDLRQEFHALSLGRAFSYISKLHSKGLFHGNLQPANILVGQDDVLLLEPSFGIAQYDGPERHQLFSCLTGPDYYPMLDPEQDALALGLILYYFFTGQHPIIAPPMVTEPTARRADPRLGAIIDIARERGTNRFLSPLLSFINPRQSESRLTDAVELLILRTLGFYRAGIGTDDEILQVTPGSWLDLRLDPEGVNLQNLWTLNRLGEEFVAIIEERMGTDLEAAS